MIKHYHRCMTVFWDMTGKVQIGQTLGVAD